MPTSLTYIVLSTRGCSPWRPAAVISTTRNENYSLLRIFKGPRKCTGHYEKLQCFAEYRTLSPGNLIPGYYYCVKKKRKLFPGPSLASPNSVALPQLKSPSPIFRPKRGLKMVFYRHLQYPQSGKGILTFFPFDEVVRLVYPVKPKIKSLKKMLPPS